jgi:DNA polymerase-1
MQSMAEGLPGAGPEPNRLLLVDGHSYAYRAFHAIGGLRAPDGRPTNATFGFIKMLEKARGRVMPTHVAVVWDGGLDAGRLESWPEYKAQRPEMPGDLAVQLDEIAAYLEAAGILSVCREGIEAEELIAAMTAQACRAGWRVVIATSDKDFMQLVSEEVALLNPGDKSQSLWDAERVREKTGVRPSQVVDWLSLVGDSVDNIPGVPGVGPKTAAKLLAEFGSVAGLYGALDRVQPERLRPALQQARDAVLRNQALVRLSEDQSGAPALSECAPRPENRARLRQLACSWGFRSMAEAYGDGPPQQAWLL